MSQGLLPFEERMVFSVSELLGELRGSLQRDFGEIWVEGEIGSLHRSPAGHVYFDLKDDSSVLRSVVFRSRANDLGFELEAGLEVCCGGRLDVFAPRGSLQLVAETLEPAGIGALRIAFEQLRARLEAEGLFDAAHKRELPVLPRRIGLVTSQGGAALHDFLRGLRRRHAAVEVVLAHSRVQGDGAWRELVRGLHALAADPSIDVIVLARGGGSIEDLWAFNREELVRAVFDVETPVVSAIGHEVDIVLTDLVADLRAATPTAAAELVVPDGALLRRRVAERLAALARRLDGAHDRLRREIASGLERRRVRVEPIAGRLARAASSALSARRERLAAIGGRLDALSPLGVLGRGYGIVRHRRDGPILTSVEGVEPGDELQVRLAEGALLASVREVLPEP